MNSGTHTMNQGDVFLFINNIFGVTYENLADTLSDIAQGAQVIDTSVVNRMAHQHRKGSELLADKADEIFAAFIADPLSRMTQEERDCKLFHAKEWVSSRSRTFLGMDSNDPCEEWIMRMLKCSLMNWNACYDPECRKTSRKLTVKRIAKLIGENLSKAKIVMDDLELNLADFIALS